MFCCETLKNNVPDVIHWGLAVSLTFVKKLNFWNTQEHLTQFMYKQKIMTELEVNCQ